MLGRDPAAERGSWGGQCLKSPDPEWWLRSHISGLAFVAVVANALSIFKQGSVNLVCHVSSPSHRFRLLFLPIFFLASTFAVLQPHLSQTCVKIFVLLCFSFEALGKLLV